MALNETIQKNIEKKAKSDIFSSSFFRLCLAFNLKHKTTQSYVEINLK